jgi:hypothetical protein
MTAAIALRRACALTIPSGYSGRLPARHLVLECDENAVVLDPASTSLVRKVLCFPHGTAGVDVHGVNAVGCFWDAVEADRRWGKRGSCERRVIRGSC